MSILFCCGVTESDAQFKFREPPNRQLPNALDREDGDQLWSYFLNSRAQGMFLLEGYLIHRPAQEASQRFFIRLQGDWNRLHEVSTITLWNESGEQSGQQIRIDREVSIIEYFEESDNSWKRVEEGFMNTSIFPGLPLSWEDFLMPYLRWESVDYKGPFRYLGRPAHRYELQNPDERDEPSRLIAVLDEDYAALLELEFVSKNGNMLRRFRVSGFKEFPAGWMFSALVWENRLDRSSVRFELEDYSIPNK